MIVYFTDRKMNILGYASNKLRKGLVIQDDTKTEDVETGVKIFECTVGYTAKTEIKLSECMEVGNYILRSNDGEKEFYTIIESEKDTKNQTIYVYAEDAGLDLLNEVVGPYEADKAYSIEYYVNKFSLDSGFEIGINEIPNLTRKLSWDGDATATERIASVATQFDNAEVSYSFDTKGLIITHKYINIYKKRGKESGIQLRLNREVDRIITNKSIANLATGLDVTGGTPEGQDNPITLSGYTYDDGDMYVSGTKLLSRDALGKWSRYVWDKEPGKIDGYTGHIMQRYSYDTTSQSELCAHAVTELKKLSQIEVNYEVEISRLPDNAKIGDTVSIVDRSGELYVSCRILKLEVSATNDKRKATLGDYLIKGSGISQKVRDLAEQFSKLSVSAARAKQIADAAKTAADAAQAQANAAAEGASAAQSAANSAQATADTAQESANAAQTAADTAQAAVDTVEESVQGIQETVDNAQTAAQNAWNAAETADEKAEAAANAAANALADAADAKAAVEVAQSTANTAVSKADEAQSTADTAKTTADSAKATADAAKLDAQTAQDEIDALGESLDTLSQTMEADYARKTDLTEAEASLQTQISQNAAQINSTASKVEKIDETVNDAAEQAQLAQTIASAAQAQADQASEDAAAAQTAADNAAQAAQDAQGEADTARNAAQTAQQVADKAQQDLEAAKSDLETVTNRVGATEEEIETARAAVEAAQAAADKAQADADAAVSSATSAQTKADNAAQAAQDAQTAADDAASKASAAQLVADEAKGDAAAAQATANAAQEAANSAQNTANTAKNNAAAAQATADAAAEEAAAAQTAADAADQKAVQAAADLETAKQNLLDVTSRVDATEEEVEAAQAAVVAAQEAADQAAEEAAAAQSTADIAKNNAATAQAAADTAHEAAQAAQEAAENAQAAADEAQAAADALEIRVTSAETQITQNAEAIALAATKEEVRQTLGGYYTKEETDAAIQLEAEGIKSSVSQTITEEVGKIEVGGRNLIPNSSFNSGVDDYTIFGDRASDTITNTVEMDTERFEGNGVAVIERTGSDGSIRYGIQTAPTITSYKAGESFILSAWIYVVTALDDEDDDNDIFVRGSRGTLSQVDRPIITIPSSTETGKWIKMVSDIYTTPEDGTFTGFYALLGKNGKIKISQMKLEKGNKATDWTPAPEDVDSGIQNAQNTADEANNMATSTEERVTVTESEIQQLADSISMLVTDSEGNSMMTQTSDGWRFDISSITENLDAAKEQLYELAGSVANADRTIQNVKDLADDLAEKTAYIVMTTDDNGDPCIELGKSDNDFKLRITNESIDFMDGTSRIAYVSNQMLYVTKAVIKDELQIGEGSGYVWKKRSNGNMGLRYVGG